MVILKLDKKVWLCGKPWNQNQVSTVSVALLRTTSPECGPNGPTPFRPGTFSNNGFLICFTQIWNRLFRSTLFSFWRVIVPRNHTHTSGRRIYLKWVGGFGGWEGGGGREGGGCESLSVKILGVCHVLTQRENRISREHVCTYSSLCWMQQHISACLQLTDVV